MPIIRHLGPVPAAQSLGSHRYISSSFLTYLFLIVGLVRAPIVQGWLFRHQFEPERLRNLKLAIYHCFNFSCISSYAIFNSCHQLFGVLEVVMSVISEDVAHGTVSG